MIILKAVNILVFFSLCPKVMHDRSFYWAGFFGMFENITIELTDSLSLEMLCLLHQGETNAASSDSGVVNRWKCEVVWRKYWPTTSFPTLPMIFNIKKSFVEVPRDVINYHLTNYFQLWKIHQKLKNMKMKNCWKRDNEKVIHLLYAKSISRCYLIKLPKC